VAAPTLTGIIVSKTGSFLLAFVMLFVVLLIGAFANLVLVGEVAPVAWPQQSPVTSADGNSR
jgi:MFS-type transporter involved in bile tolerance (Atg22 family)